MLEFFFVIVLHFHENINPVAGRHYQYTFITQQLNSVYGLGFDKVFTGEFM